MDLLLKQVNVNNKFPEDAPCYETDVDRYFHENILDIWPVTFRLIRIGKSPTSNKEVVLKKFVFMNKFTVPRWVLIKPFPLSHSDLYDFLNYMDIALKHFSRFFLKEGKNMHPIPEPRRTQSSNVSKLFHNWYIDFAKHKHSFLRLGYRILNPKTKKYTENVTFMLTKYGTRTLSPLDKFDMKYEEMLKLAEDKDILIKSV